MSFMDPDQRERMQKQSEERQRQQRDHCARTGSHTFSATAKCACGVIDPQPRVVLETSNMRAVWNPARMSLTVERSSTDATGTKRWDHLFIMNNNGFDPAASTKFMSQIYTLITEGVRP